MKTRDGIQFTLGMVLYALQPAAGSLPRVVEMRTCWSTHEIVGGRLQQIDGNVAAVVSNSFGDRKNAIQAVVEHRNTWN